MSDIYGELLNSHCFTMSNPEQTEEIVLSGYNTITWKDERLKWDTEKYDGYGVYQHMEALIG